MAITEFSIGREFLNCLLLPSFPPSQASYSGVSKSVLRFTPTIEDDGRYLTCRAENMALHNTVMEDQWDLQVHCEYFK